MMENLEKVKKEYEIVKKEYSLPSFEDFDKEFEIRAVELDKSGIFIKTVLRVVLSRIGLYLNYLEPIFSPNPQSFHSMVETTNISREDKENILKFFKEVSSLYHGGCAVELDTYKNIASYIKKVWKKWPYIKGKEKEFLEIITKAWLKEEEKTKTTYTG